jgi:hypothetical protein
MRLGDLQVLLMRPDGIWWKTSIHDSPFYRSLPDSQGVYDHYRNEILLKHLPSLESLVRNFDEFLTLVEKIRVNGFDHKSQAPVVLFHDCIADGQHRMCALLHLYGADTQLIVTEGRARNRNQVWQEDESGVDCRFVTGVDISVANA